MFWQLKIERAKSAKLQAKINNLQARARHQKELMDILANGIAGYHHSDYCASGSRSKCSKMCDKRYWLAWARKELKRKEKKEREIHRRKK